MASKSGLKTPQKTLTKLFALFEPKNVKNHVTLNFLTPPVMIFVFSISNYPYIDQKMKNEKNKNGFEFFCVLA